MDHDPRRCSNDRRMLTIGFVGVDRVPECCLKPALAPLAGQPYEVVGGMYFGVVSAVVVVVAAVEDRSTGDNVAKEEGLYCGSYHMDIHRSCQRLEDAVTTSTDLAGSTVRDKRRSVVALHMDKDKADMARAEKAEDNHQLALERVDMEGKDH